MIPTSTEELTELLEKATKGVWTHSLNLVFGGDGSPIAHYCKTDEHAALIVAAVNALPGLMAENARLKAALAKIDAIRNSIIGLQNINWSEHIYPLVAALEEAGYEGADYEIARKNVGTLIEQAKAADARAEAAEAEVERLKNDHVELSPEMARAHVDLFTEMKARAELAEAKLSALGGGEREARARTVFAVLSPHENWEGFVLHRDVRGGYHPMQERAFEVVDALSTPAIPWRPEDEPSWRAFLATDMEWLADHGQKIGPPSCVGYQAIERLLRALSTIPLPTPEEDQ